MADTIVPRLATGFGVSQGKTYRFVVRTTPAASDAEYATLPDAHFAADTSGWVTVKISPSAPSDWPSNARNTPPTNDPSVRDYYLEAVRTLPGPASSLGAWPHPPSGPPRPWPILAMWAHGDAVPAPGPSPSPGPSPAPAPTPDPVVEPSGGGGGGSIWPLLGIVGAIAVVSVLGGRKS